MCHNCNTSNLPPSWEHVEHPPESPRNVRLLLDNGGMIAAQWNGTEFVSDETFEIDSVLGWRARL